MGTLAGKFAEFFSEVQYEDLPEEVVDHAKKYILDLIGVTIGGLSMPFPKMVIDYLMTLGGKSEATLMGTPAGTKLPAIHAAFGNGVCGHALDMDDGYRYGGVHPSVSTIPAAIAAGEARDAGGKDVILATVLGSEIVNRLAKAMNPSHLSRGFHTTGTLGPFGAAVAVGKIYGLDPDRMTKALGLAGLQGAGLLEILNDGAMAKPIHPGKAAMAGIISVELAQRGAHGPVSVFEGDKGFFKAMADEVNQESLVDGLGETYLIGEQYIKLHAACRHVHPAIDAMLQLKQDNRLSVSDIESIYIETYPTALDFCGGKDQPKSGEAAKFSLPYSVALAAYYDDAGMNRFCKETMENSDIQELSSRIKAASGEKWEKGFPHIRGASLKITTKGGEQYSIDVDLPKGEPENPATHDDLINKFKSNAAGMDKEKCDALISTILNLENHSVSDLTTYYTGI